MLNLNNLTPKKFFLSTSDYDKIFMMWKDKLTYQEIADEFGLARSQISIIVNQIISYIDANRNKYDLIKSVLKVKDEAMSSYKSLLFPVDNEATIGTSKVIKGKIYSDGKLWQ